MLASGFHGVKRSLGAGEDREAGSTKANIRLLAVATYAAKDRAFARMPAT